MPYTTVDNPELYFQAKAWTGTGNEIAITFDGSENMEPDWVWLKKRNASAIHVAHDSVRGATKRLIPNSSDAETTQAQYVKSFDSNGITFGTDTDVNNSGSPAILWGWKAGTSFTNDASATGIGSIDSSGSVSNTAGFSIVSYTGTGGTETIKHGLSSKPAVILVKKRSGAANWYMYHHKNTSAPETDFLVLNSTAATSDNANNWNDTQPTSSVFSVGASGTTNPSGGTMIAYCFAEKKGYSKFGSYKGNGSSDGTNVFLGFKPAVLIYKNTSQSDEWFIHDNKRQGFNDDNEYLFPSSTQAEGTANRIRFTSNGFKTLDSDKGVNASGDVYVYMAFAESPSTNSSGIPNNAR